MMKNLKKNICRNKKLKLAIRFIKNKIRFTLMRNKEAKQMKLKIKNKKKKVDEMDWL